MSPFTLRAGVSYERPYRAGVRIPGFVKPAAFTMACWIRCDRRPDEDGRRIFSQFDRSLLHVLPGDNSWSLENLPMANKKLVLYGAESADTDPGNNYVYSTDDVLTYGHWNHVVCSVSASGPRLYCDGQRLALTAVGVFPTLRVSSMPLWCGLAGQNVDPETGWLGDQSQVMAWERQLSDREVADLYAGYSPDYGRILWLPLDDGDGDTARNLDDPTMPGELQARNLLPKHTVWITASKSACTRRVLWFGGATLRGISSNGEFAGYIRRLVAAAVGAAEVDGKVQFVGDYSEGDFGENRHSMLNEDETIAMLAMRLIGDATPLSTSFLSYPLIPAFTPTDTILSCGVHDMPTFTPTTTVAAYKAAIIDPLLAAGSRVFVTTLLPQAGQAWAANVALFNEELRLMVEQHIIATDTSTLVFVDITTGYDPAWSINWVVPRERGMSFIAGRIATAMRLTWGAP